MNLIEELRSAKGFTAGVILSFDVTLDWFERLLGVQMAFQGIRRLAILADAECLSETIAEQVPAALRGAGRHYVVQGIKMPRGRFHPKVVLLSGPATARLYVGSGNLSASGFGRNLEVFERWDAVSTTGAVPRAFDSVRRYVDQILDGQVGLARPIELQEVLDKVFGTDVLVRKPFEPTGPELLGSPGSLFDRLPSLPTGATTLTLVAPYFDDGGQLVSITRGLLPSDHAFDVVTDPRRSNLSRRATHADPGPWWDNRRPGRGALTAREGLVRGWARVGGFYHRKR